MLIVKQNILLVSSTHATPFGSTDHSQAFKYMIFKAQNEMHIQGEHKCFPSLQTFLQEIQGKTLCLFFMLNL
jgi:hypothetical protein